MILPFLYINGTELMGRGVFTSEDIEAGTLIEVAPVIVMGAEERKLLDQTLLHDYIFEWDQDSKKCCLALGYVSIYNHSFSANCEYEMDFNDQTIQIKTRCFVKSGEELFINYNGEWNNSKKLWFHTE